MFQGFLAEAGPGLIYGLRAYGPHRPEAGHLFNPHKLLLDPCAREIVGQFAWDPANHGYTLGDAQGIRSLDARDNASIALKARVVTLSNVSLEEAVRQGSFRQDLFYRLNVVPLMIPPLRARPEDIRPIAKKILGRLAESYQRPQLELTRSAYEALENYAFPGNVRELRNLLERAVVNSVGGAISAEDFPASVRNGGASAASKPSLEELERSYIAEILDYTRGKKTKAADILGISRKTLLEKRKKYQL